MYSTDPIADMLTRIRNALNRSHREVLIPHSRLKEQIAQILLRYQYITACQAETTERGQILKLQLVNDQQPISPITELKRLSRPGRRLYVGCADIPQVKNGRGLVIVSTNQGLMTNRQARKARLGGEVLCSIY